MAPLPSLQPVCSCLDCQQVLSALANNAKTNQHRHVDEHSTLRHRLVELCQVGALALLFYIQFHVLSHLLPGFAPTFGQPNPTMVSLAIAPGIRTLSFGERTLQGRYLMTASSLMPATISLVDSCPWGDHQTTTTMSTSCI